MSSTELWVFAKPVLNLAGVILLCTLILVIVTLSPYALLSSRPKDFPPGPPTVPILGNLHLIPPTRSFLTFKELSKKYGPIVGLKFASANVVVLNNYKDVEELLERRGNIYSSRPPSYIAQELIYPGDLHILMNPYGPTWRAQRRATNLLLAPRAFDELLPRLEAPTTQCIIDILRDPANYYELLRHLAANIMFVSVYGLHGVQFDDPRIAALFDTQHRMKSLLEPGAAPPVDAIGFLRYLPELLAPWKRQARQLREDIRELYVGEYTAAKNRLQDGSGAGCFVDKLIQEQEKLGLDEEQLAYVAGSMLEAGSDTSASQLQSFILGCLQNPAALRKAQEEVDACCGLNRPPCLADLDQLPYIEACMNEVLRWRPVGPAGAPHMLTQTDSYKGYVLPAGTIVFANAWGLQHDENEYEKPDLFNPDRWQGNRYGTKYDSNGLSTKDRKLTYVFGAGRRICGGQKQAEVTLKLAIAKLVWTFQFTKLSEDETKDIDTNPVTAYTAGFTMAPHKFPVKIEARSEKHAQMIVASMENIMARQG
ncbi:putative cytochrome P450 [Thozetella sp. PMI_491]|nr:putative cytochrome P450 [Thozetella sp. PMI_491]